MMNFDKKRMFHLRRRRDDLTNTVKTMAENNLNNRMELSSLKCEMTNILNSTLEMKRRIGRKKRHVVRIVTEMRKILGSYCSHLDLLTLEADIECDEIWKSFLNGSTKSFDHFLESFLEVRKDYHIYKFKASKLSNELSLIEEVPFSSASSSSSSED